MTPEQRFWSRVNKTDTCWLWTAGALPSGYGHFGADDRKYLAHRFAYELRHGPIPPGLVIDHLCRVPACVNPDHLEAVEQRVNILRGRGPEVQRQRAASQTHCKHGHEFTPENTIWVLKKQRYRSRMCRICKNATARRLRARQRAAS